MGKAQACRKEDGRYLLAFNNSSMVYNGTKMPLAPVKFLAPISAGKNCSEYCSPDDMNFQFPALLVNTHFLCASAVCSFRVFLLLFSYLPDLFIESTFIASQPSFD